MATLNLPLIRLMLLNVAAADACAIPSEFTPRFRIPALYERLKDKGFPLRPVGGGPFGFAPGEHSDDTAMALAMARSFVDLRGVFDPADVAAHWVAWLRSHPPDVGGTVRRVLTRIASGVGWFEAGREEFHARPTNAANGSLMRNGVVCTFADSLAEAFEFSLKQGIVTHFAPLPVLCCAVQTWQVWQLLRERWFFASGDWLRDWHADWTGWVTRCEDEHVAAWLQDVERDGRLDEAMQTLCDAEFDPDAFDPFTASIEGRDGYCLLTLQIATWATAWSRRTAKAHPFPLPHGFDAMAHLFTKRRGAVLTWLALVGHDSDTYAAAAAPIVAAANEGKLPASMTRGLAVRREAWLFEDRDEPGGEREPDDATATA